MGGNHFLFMIHTAKIDIKSYATGVVQQIVTYQTWITQYFLPKKINSPQKWRVNQSVSNFSGRKGLVSKVDLEKAKRVNGLPELLKEIHTVAKSEKMFCLFILSFL